MCTTIECCWNPPKWAQRAPHVVFALSVALVAVLFLVAWAGFAVNVVQNAEIDELSSALSSFAEWHGTADSTLAGTANQTDAVLAAIASTVDVALYFDTANDNFGDLQSLKQTTLAALWSMKASVVDAATAVTVLRTGTVATLGSLLAEEVADWQQFLESANKVRHIAVLATWVALLVLAGFNLVSAAIFKWKTALYQKRLACCARVMSGLYMLALVVMFGVCAMMLVFTKASTDFCQPNAIDANFRSFGSINMSSGNNTNDYIIAYYIDCDRAAAAAAGEESSGAAGAAAANPTNPGAQTVGSSFRAAMDALDVLHETVERKYEAIDKNYAAVLQGQAKADYRPTYVEATAAIKSIDYPVYVLQTAADAMDATFSGSMTPQGVDSGALSVLQCYQLNVRYRAAMNQLCGKVYPTIGMTFELLAAATVMMLLMDVLARMLRPTQPPPPEWDGNIGEDEVEGLMPLRQRLMSAVSFYNDGGSDDEDDREERPSMIAEEGGVEDGGGGGDAVGDVPVVGSIAALLKPKPPAPPGTPLSPVQSGAAPRFAAAFDLPPPNLAGGGGDGSDGGGGGSSGSGAVAGSSVAGGSGAAVPAAAVLAATGGGDAASVDSSSGDDGDGAAAAVAAALPLTKTEKKAAEKAKKAAVKAAKEEAKAAAKAAKADAKKAKKAGVQVAPAEGEDVAATGVSGVAAAINRPMTAPTPTEKQVNIGSDFLSQWAGGLGGDGGDDGDDGDDGGGGGGGDGVGGDGSGGSGGGSGSEEDAVAAMPTEPASTSAMVTPPPVRRGTPPAVTAATVAETSIDGVQEAAAPAAANSAFIVTPPPVRRGTPPVAAATGEAASA